MGLAARAGWLSSELSSQLSSRLSRGSAVKDCLRARWAPLELCLSLSLLLEWRNGEPSLLKPASWLHN